MILHIRVVPKSSRTAVKEDNGGWKVYLTRPARDGLANEQLVEVLSGYLKVKKYLIRIIKGEKSRNKIIEVDDGNG
ncbi:MAG: DUF167 domain-containing protein [Candidatus Omnitrophica bacterium]|nr:DUF167 domain-containing protein [Candidatus Omnitrophota bacterium]